MLMYAEDRPDILNIKMVGKGIVFNLASLKEGYSKLNLLVPPNELGRFTDRDFDIAYANYIMSNDSVFMQFFWIIYNLYIGVDVLIIISGGSDWTENILESLLKLIQQRYGYNGTKIDSEEDYIYARNYINSDFAPGYGLYNLDMDKERFTYLVESFRLFTNNLPFPLEGFICHD